MRMGAAERSCLIETIVHHAQRCTPDGPYAGGCHCGWHELGKSYAEHVVTVFEESMAARRGFLDAGER